MINLLVSVPCSTTGGRLLVTNLELSFVKTVAWSGKFSCSATSLGLGSLSGARTHESLWLACRCPPLDWLTKTAHATGRPGLGLHLHWGPRPEFIRRGVHERDVINCAEYFSHARLPGPRRNQFRWPGQVESLFNEIIRPADTSRVAAGRSGNNGGSHVSGHIFHLRQRIRKKNVAAGVRRHQWARSPTIDRTSDRCAAIGQAWPAGWPARYCRWRPTICLSGHKCS